MTKLEELKAALDAACADAMDASNIVKDAVYDADVAATAADAAYYAYHKEREKQNDKNS